MRIAGAKASLLDGLGPKHIEGATVAAPSSGECDVLVIFGITGDLARVMTFRSLYRLEQRGLLSFPIVGVAFDDWTIERLDRARPGVDRGSRRADRPPGL